jgi:hypothetical protein
LNSLSARSWLLFTEVKTYILLKEMLASWNTTGKEFHMEAVLWRTCSSAWRQIARSLSCRWHKHDTSVILYFSGCKFVILWMWQRVIYKLCAVC